MKNTNNTNNTKNTNTPRNLRIGLAFVITLAVLGACQSVFDKSAADTAAGGQGGDRAIAPVFEVDPLWPKPLPNKWLIGMAIGVWVDEQDNIWIIHRGAATLHPNERALDTQAGECCTSAPP